MAHRIHPTLQLCLVASLVVGLAAVFAWWARTPLPNVLLPDGRLLHVEGISYGTVHWIGPDKPFLKPFSLLIKGALRLFGTAPWDESRTDFPSLALWFTATDPKTGKAVDCQGLRVELLDKQAHVYTSTAGSSGTLPDGSSRTEHIFAIFPRAERELTVRLTPFMDEDHPSTVRIRNPHVTRPANWLGQSVPLRKKIGDIDVVLSSLSRRTNGALYDLSQTNSLYWEPTFVLEKDGHPVAGWSEALWDAEDALGNHGRWIAAHQKVVRFHATFYPDPTNRTAAVLLTNGPAFRLADLTNAILWNLKTRFDTVDLAVIGLFPPGPQCFSNGVYQPNPPPGYGSSDPKSIWGRMDRPSLFRLNQWNGYTSQTAELLVRVNPLKQGDGGVRFGVRLRDAQGSLWPLKSESDSGMDAVRRFRIELPPEVGRVVPEIVALKPVTAAYDVDTTSTSVVAGLHN